VSEGTREPGSGSAGGSGPTGSGAGSDGSGAGLNGSAGVAGAGGLAGPAGSDAGRGARLGLPPAGPGSLATAGPRIAAFALDAVLSALVAGLFTAPELPRLWSLLAFGCQYAFFVATFGQTPGMALCRLRVARVGRSGSPAPAAAGLAGIGLGRAALRTLLLVLLVPAVIFDSDGRGLHDRLTGTAVLRLR